MGSCVASPRMRNTWLGRGFWYYCTCVLPCRICFRRPWLCRTAMYNVPQCHHDIVVTLSCRKLALSYSVAPLFRPHDISGWWIASHTWNLCHVLHMLIILQPLYLCTIVFSLCHLEPMTHLRQEVMSNYVCYHSLSQKFKDDHKWWLLQATCSNL